MTIKTQNGSARGVNFFRALGALDASLLLLALMQFVTQLGVAVMLPLLPLYAITLGATPIQQGLLTSAFAITTAIGQLGVGGFIDRFGARMFIRGGVALYAGANVLIATAFDALSLIAYRGLAGLGGGSNLIASRVYLAQKTDPARMAFVNGAISAASSAGQVGGPAIGGLIAALADLRLPFLIVGVTSGLAFLGSLFLPAVRARHVESAQTAAPPSIWNRSVIVLLVSQLLLLSAYGGWITTFAPLATQTLGWSTVQVGSTFSLFGLGSIVLGPWLAHLADRFGRRIVAMLAVLPVAAFSIVIVVGASEWVVYAVMFLGGAGLTAYNAAWFAMLSSVAPSAQLGRTFGYVNAISQLGVVIGATIASFIWQTVNVSAAMLAPTAPVLLASTALLTLPKSNPPSGTQQ